MKQLLILLTTLLLGVHGASAAIVFQVDVSDPSAVVITATGEASNVAGTMGTFENGVFLWEFFSGNTSRLGFGGTGDLTIGAYSTTARFDDYYKGTSGSLLLYDYNRTDPLAFSLINPAFVGSIVIDFSEFAAELPSAGWSEEVTSWDGSNVIGHYVVVPEPSMAFLGAAGLAVFSLSQLRSRKRASSRQRRSS